MIGKKYLFMTDEVAKLSIILVDILSIILIILNMHPNHAYLHTLRGKNSFTVKNSCSFDTTGKTAATLLSLLPAFLKQS